MKVLSVLAAVVAVTGCTRTPSPDIVIVTWDTVRADHAGPDSVIPNLTPRLNELARDGVRFTHARTPSPITLPAHAALMTGLRPDETGVRTNGLFALPESATTLAERAKDAGYATGAFISAAVLNPEYGLNQGFDTYNAGGGGTESSTSFAERPANTTVDAALGWMATRGETPTFLWVHLFDAHLPLQAPAAFATAHPDNGYAAEIAFADAETGRLFDGLAALGRLDRSLIAVTSDHGEGLGEHGEATHAYFAYDSTVRVPLILRAGPTSGITTKPGVVRGPAFLTDLAPTLIELLKWPTMPTSGTSLVASLQTGTPLPPRELYIECAEPAFAFGTAPVFGVIDSAGDSWFDLPRREHYAAGDGDQMHNLYDHATEAMAGDARFGRQDRAWPPRVTRTLDAAEIERLAALGYVGGGAATSAVHDVGEGPDPKDLLPVAALVMSDQPTLAPETALREAVELRAKFGPVPILTMVEADALEAMGRRSEAIKALEEPAKRYPSEGRLQVKLAGFIEAQTQDRALLTAIRAARLERPKDSQVAFDLGFILHRLGELAEAESLYREVLTTTPEDADARVNLARVLGALESDEAALAVLRDHPQPEATVLCSMARIQRRDAEDAGIESLRACREAGGELRPDEEAALRRSP
jgi:tetratricopeptide (TPR) repeat protein